MIIKWHGTAAVTLESGGFTLAVDPFIGMPIGMSDEERLSTPRAAEFRTADAVLITHGHFDHIYDVPALYGEGGAPIYATKTPAETLMAKGLRADRLHVIRPGQEFELGGFHITAYQSRHCTFDFGVILKTVFKAAALRYPKRLFELLRLNKAYPENGETMLYEIAADGRRVQLMGSMGMAKGQNYPTGADLLILPFQGTADPAKTVAPIIEALKPKRILLDHYDDAFPPMSSMVKTKAFERKTTAVGIPAQAMELNISYEV